MREILSWAQRHYRIDVTASTVERKTSEPASAGTCPGGCIKDRTRISSGSRARSVVPFERKNVIRHDRTKPHVPIDTWITGEATHSRERHIVSIVELTFDFVPREIFNAIEATRPASSNRNEERAHFRCFDLSSDKPSGRPCTRA